jgi:hypothetical protein
VKYYLKIADLYGGGFPPYFAMHVVIFEKTQKECQRVDMYYLY